MNRIKSDTFVNYNASKCVPQTDQSNQMGTNFLTRMNTNDVSSCGGYGCGCGYGYVPLVCMRLSGKGVLRKEWAVKAKNPLARLVRE